MYSLEMFLLFKFVKALRVVCCFFSVQHNVIMNKAFPKPFLSQGPDLEALGHY